MSGQRTDNHKDFFIFFTWRIFFKENDLSFKLVINDITESGVKTPINSNSVQLYIINIIIKLILGSHSRSGGLEQSPGHSSFLNPMHSGSDFKHFIYLDLIYTDMSLF